jgi:HSP20 family protein
MSIFDEFGRLQDTVNALMGDFGSRTGGLGRPGGRRRRGGQGGWGLDDWGMVDEGFGFGGFDPMMDLDVYSTPLLTSGTTGGWDSGQRQGRLQGKQGMEENKMDESSGPSTALSTQQGGGQLSQRQGGLQLPLLRCRVNIEEQKDKYLITAEVPGFDKENLKVNISDNNVMTITGEQRKEHVEESKEKRYIRTERAFGRVQRSLGLPKNVNKDNIHASYENGILHINVPKREEQKEQRQEVQIH